MLLRSQKFAERQNWLFHCASLRLCAACSCKKWWAHIPSAGVPWQRRCSLAFSSDASHRCGHTERSSGRESGQPALSFWRQPRLFEWGGSSPTRASCLRWNFAWLQSADDASQSNANPRTPLDFVHMRMWSDTQAKLLQFQYQGTRLQQGWRWGVARFVARVCGGHFAIPENGVHKVFAEPDDNTHKRRGSSW